MSKVTTARTEASSEEKSSREVDLYFEVETKLSQARGICALICEIGDNEAVSEAASAAEDLIEGVIKARQELLDIQARPRPEGGSIMSTDMASTDPTPASSGSQWSRTMELVDEIKKRLGQANGITIHVVGRN